LLLNAPKVFHTLFAINGFGQEHFQLGLEGAPMLPGPLLEGTGGAFVDVANEDIGHREPA